jgi:hypothetical protein
MASKKKIVKPDYMGSLADYKASVSQPRSNTPAPPPPSKKETATRNVLNAFKGYLSIREERNSKYSDKPTNSPSYSTRERTSDITAFLADMRYKSAINDFWADKNDIKDQVNARWNEAEAQLNLRGKNLSFDPKWREKVDKMNKKKKIR